jgi:hypothetical protein
MKHTLLQETFPAVSIEKKVDFPAKGGVLINHRLCRKVFLQFCNTCISYIRRIAIEV